MKLDRTVHKVYNFNNQVSEASNYKNMPLKELFEVFNYLQSVAYNFRLNSYPKMDKTVHSCRKNG